MGKALIAVGTFLSICFLIFGGVVYLTRQEDRYAVDAQLSEHLTRAVAEAEPRGEDVDLRNLADFDFDRVLIYDPGTPRSAVSKVLGFEFKGDLRYTAESSEIFVFTNRGKFVRFADYRGRGSFAGLPRPIAYLSANAAVFKVHDLVASPG